MLYKDTKTTRDWLVHEMEHGFLDHQREILRGGSHCAPGRVAAPPPKKNFVNRFYLVCLRVFLQGLATVCGCERYWGNV